MVREIKKYDQEFIERSIKLALSSAQPIAQTARELGVSPSTLHGWIQKNKELKIKIEPKAQDIYEELGKLRKEIAKLREEREILKKAAAFFAKEQK